jgi:hypothetical protein
MGAGARSAEQFSANQTESYEEYVKISQLIDETKVDIARWVNIVSTSIFSTRFECII